MRVSSLNNYNLNPSMKGYTYRPNRNPVYINPVKLQVDNFFERTLKASKNRFYPIIDALALYHNEVPLKKGNVETYALDFDKENPSGKYVMVLHGLGQNVSAMQPLYKSILEETEYSVFAPEYRGFGKNKPAKISKKTFLEDTQIALDYLVNEKQIKPENICVVGHSLGGFVASQFAKNNPNIERLILVSSADSLESEMMSSSIAKHISPFVRFIVKHIGFIRGYVRSIFDTTENLGKTHAPVDIIHSMNDRIVDYKSAKNLAKICPNLQGVHLLSGGGHGMEPKKIAEIISLLK